MNFLTVPKGCLLAMALLVHGSCGGDGGSSPPPPLTGWAAIRANTHPSVALPAEFGTPRVQELAVDGWEDGICISRGGLHLYAVYVPADLLSFTLAGADQHEAESYLRGPTFGMDLTTIPPVGAPLPTMWLHGDILHASRSSLGQPFSAWQRTTMSQPVWSEGAPQPSGAGGADWDLFAYTTNDHPTDYNAHTVILHHAAHDPIATGSPLPAPVTTATNEDNPHVERLSANDLVLFFDSGDRQVGRIHDLWYTTSADDGITWTAPASVTSINTVNDEHQPHLWKDSGGVWWLYYTATNPGDGKLGIFRAKQQTPGDWDSWTAKELVIGAGNALAVGEPTLTANGDLSFVVITEDTVNGTATNRYDGDPWFVPRIPAGGG